MGTVLFKTIRTVPASFRSILPPAAKLDWTQHVELLPLENTAKKIYLEEKIIREGLSAHELSEVWTAARLQNYGKLHPSHFMIKSKSVMGTVLFKTIRTVPDFYQAMRSLLTENFQIVGLNVSHSQFR